MRYTLTAGRVLSRGEWVALGSVLDLSDDEAARYRLGGCTLELVAEPAPPADTEANDAEPCPKVSAPPARRRKPRRTPAEG